MKKTLCTAFSPLVLLAFCSSGVAQLKTPDDQHAVERAEMVDHIGIMEKYLYLVDHMARLADNATGSGIAGVLSAAEMLRGHPQDAIDYYNRVLPDVKNDSVRRAIRLQLADLYNEAHQQDKALDQLRELMVSAPSPRTTRASAPPVERR